MITDTLLNQTFFPSIEHVGLTNIYFTRPKGTGKWPVFQSGSIIRKWLMYLDNIY